MELKNLQQHIRTLVTLEETEAPVISCYLNLEGAESAHWKALDARVGVLRKSLEGKELQYFEEALIPIDSFVRAELLFDACGAAIFSRGGRHPFFLPLQFRVPLPHWVTVNSTANIYHLVELKDTYHRYVVLLCTEERARILEVNLGSVTEELWKSRPELRQRVGREWTKERYQSHLWERTNQFINEAIEILNQLMSADGHTHLILAGNPRMTSWVRKALPQRLEAKLIDTVGASIHDQISDIVAATLFSFVDQEEQESLVMVEKLQQKINTHGLAVIGTGASLAALQRRLVDVLILAKSFYSEPGWSCKVCGAIRISSQKPPACASCGHHGLHELDMKEELVRLGELTGCKVETVKHSDVLMRFGGVGCLLRYVAPEDYYQESGVIGAIRHATFQKHSIGR